MTLPDGWSQATLADLIAHDGVFTDGDWVETKDQDPSGTVRLTQLADVGEGVFRDRSNRFLRADQADALNCTFLQPGDVLVARMPDPLGRACLVPELGQPAVTAVDVCIIRPGPGSVDSRWLMWAINSPQFRRAVDGLQSGTTRKRISRKNLASIDLPVPPVGEQRRIVAAIEEQFSRLEACRPILNETRARIAVLRRSVLSRAFDVGAEHAPLAAITDPDRPICYGILKPKTVGDLVVPYVEVRSIVGGRIDVGGLPRTTRALHEEFRRSELREGDVVLAIRGSFDRAAVVPPALNGANVSRDVARIAPLGEVDPSYLANYLASPAAFALFAAAARGVGVRGVNIGDLRKLPVPVPPIDEQRRIVVEIEQRLSLIDSLGAAVELAQRRSAALRRAILERTFRGELVLQDPNDEPGSVLLERIRVERAATPKPAPRKRVPV